MLATGEREQLAQIVFHDRFVADGCLTGQGCANSAITRRRTIPKQLDRRLYVERFRKHRLIGRVGRLQARDDLRRLGKSVDKLCGDRQLHFGPRDVINTSLICKTCAELTSLDWSCWKSTFGSSLTHIRIPDGATVLWLTGAAGRAVNLACSVAGLSCRKLNVNRPELSRLAGAPHRRLTAEPLEFFHRRSAGNLKRCPDRTGRNRVDSDALRRELLRKRLHEIHRRGFGLRIIVQFG